MVQQALEAFGNSVQKCMHFKARGDRLVHFQQNPEASALQFHFFPVTAASSKRDALSIATATWFATRRRNGMSPSENFAGCRLPNVSAPSRRSEVVRGK